MVEQDVTSRYQKEIPRSSEKEILNGQLETKRDKNRLLVRFDLKNYAGEELTVCGSRKQEI